MIFNLVFYVIGFIFLLTSMVKAAHSRKFIFHNYKYELLPPQVVPHVAITFIGLECALGMGLILQLFPQWLIPGLIVLLLCLSVLTIWSTSSGRTEDCGCYGGLLVVTPKQSIMLNLGYILLLAIAWIYRIPNYRTQTWQWVIPLAVGIIASILAWKSQDNPLIDFSRLKIGNRWKCRWLKNSPHDLQQGSHFVVFLSKDCPYCKRWVPFLNVMNGLKDVPKVTGIISLNSKELETFKDEQRVRFPLVPIDKLLLNYMVEAFPTAVLVENGIIAGKWEGEIPKEFLDKIKQSYENILLPKVRA